jgi:hypothetical protein
MYYRVMKCAISVAYFFLIALTWKFFRGKLDWNLAAGCVAVSGFWLLLTRLQMGHLLRTYFDVLSRAQVLVPLLMGVVLSGIGFIASDHLPLRVVASLELGWWAYIYVQYRLNRRKYIMQGHGPLPAGCWVNPPADALEPGDLILTSGRIANRVHESVGHGEVVLRAPNGKLVAFSSYMEKGAVINDLQWLTFAWLRRGEHYIVMRVKDRWTADQNARAYAIAEQLLAENDQWRTQANARRQALVNMLPLPASMKNWLFGKIRATGYDWPGLFIGARANNRWTCIGACLELYHRLGVKTHRYGTGLLGLGTGILDPIMPVRFLSDPAFSLLSETSKEAYDFIKGLLQCDP